VILLPREDWNFAVTEGGGELNASTHPNGPDNRFRYYERLSFSDLPNDLIGADDLEGSGVDHVYVAAVRQRASLQAFDVLNVPA